MYIFLSSAYLTALAVTVGQAPSSNTTVERFSRYTGSCNLCCQSVSKRWCPGCLLCGRFAIWMCCRRNITCLYRHYTGSWLRGWRILPCDVASDSKVWWPYLIHGWSSRSYRGIHACRIWPLFQPLHPSLWTLGMHGIWWRHCCCSGYRLL